MSCSIKGARKLNLFIAFIFLLPDLASGSIDSAVDYKTIKIAVASNFYNVTKDLCDEFSRLENIKRKVNELQPNQDGKAAHQLVAEKPPGKISCLIVQSSSGKLLSQLLNGAHYDIFLSADKKRPLHLFQEKISEEPIVYAVGQIALIASDYSQAIGETAQNMIDVFKVKPNTLQGTKIAIANPKVAPYGFAASEFLEHHFKQIPLSYKLITGHSAVQAYQFLKSNSVDYAIVPLSYVYKTDTPYWIIPQAYYTPILQALSVVTTSKENVLASKFANSVCNLFWKSILKKHGYKASPHCLNDSLDDKVLNTN